MASQTYSREEVQRHSSEDSCWVIHNNNVYDMTSFVVDHPGGEEYILDHAGQDVTMIMKDELSHFHTEGAYEMMEEFLVGTLTGPTGTTSVSLNDSSVLHKRSTSTATVTTGGKTAVTTTTISTTEEEDDYHKPTDLVADKKTKFLDLSQPLLWQLWNCNYSKSFYLEQVHIPRHVVGSAKIFGSPFLEVFTKTPWYMIPIFWLPIIAYNVNKSLEAGLTTDQSATIFFGGMIFWTFAEYMIHRFLFHVDDMLPDSSAWLVAHFLLHGIHHYLPMDRLRLVMPPALAVALAIPLNKMAHTLLPEPQAYAGISGLFFGYVLYDMCHYYLHHARPFKFHFKEMKTYHLKHHYGDYEGGYGITSKVWDKVFGTELKL
ncbi:4-hydroxysphinganine ceramide fatty acyl 2-hydroxylase [Entomortierella parvispora]|uniref:Ceramide very long chain fatty acid hydroxylase n=1 Tax=Entomortierella parvispora TaxID=205924 RepID=A0A9P3H6L3_9FUNG|nr:4-hydroxysphinganine ceramide fatty acyl 2-hydroxylase [Entomortierella parvispora]